MYKFVIGAIFKDEYDYLLEWIAWHRLAGFEHFYIADNGSTDGSRELLEALSDIGIVTILYQEQKEKAQLDAYQKILHKALLNREYILFIDADEFLFSELSELPTLTLEKLFNTNINSQENKNIPIGALCINWKVFGSSGLKTQTKDLVIERFSQYALDKFPQNKFIKSVINPVAVGSMRVHHAVLINGYQYLNMKAEIPLFFSLKNGESIDSSGKTIKYIKSPLTIHHYIVKSKEEYDTKKEEEVMR